MTVRPLPARSPGVCACQREIDAALIEEQQAMRKRVEAFAPKQPSQEPDVVALALCRVEVFFFLVIPILTSVL